MYQEISRNIEDVFLVGKQKAYFHLEINYYHIIYDLFIDHVLCASHSYKCRATAGTKTVLKLLPRVVYIPL